jgi:hypothetical protein
MASITENNMYHSLREVVELFVGVTFGVAGAITASSTFGRVTLNYVAVSNTLQIRLSDAWPQVLGVYPSVQLPATPAAISDWVRGPDILTNDLFFEDPDPNALVGTTIQLVHFAAGVVAAPASGEQADFRLLLLNTTVTP